MYKSPIPILKFLLIDIINKSVSAVKAAIHIFKAADFRYKASLSTGIITTVIPATKEHCDAEVCVRPSVCK